MPELRALVGGYLPNFVTSFSEELTEIPIFVFHTVQPHRFEHQLLHLVRNDYRCLDCDEVTSRVKLGKVRQREVALTFDDATWCFWVFAFPLLRKYQLRATLFVIPGITSDDARSYPNLDDLWAGRASSAELTARAAVQPLCTWRELEIMHKTGLIDIQSHSLTHALVPVRPRVADFLHPGFQTFFCNVAIPLSTGDDPRRPNRALRLGAPVFLSASRLAGRPRFFEDPEIVAVLERHIRANDGREFFQRPGWRAELRRILRRWPPEKRGRFEDREEMIRSIKEELVRSKEMLGHRLPGHVVRHLCYPWYQGAPLVDRLAGGAGYVTLHYGVLERHAPAFAPDGPLRLQRISEEYLLRLPGHGRAAASFVLSVWLNRAGGRLGQVLAPK